MVCVVHIERIKMNFIGYSMIEQSRYSFRSILNVLWLIGVLALSEETITAQSVDLSSVDAFLEVTAELKQGNRITEEQWEQFENTSVYKRFATRENPFMINTIKETILSVFDENKLSQNDSVLHVSTEEMAENKALMIKNLIWRNYLEVNDHYADITAFRERYDFEALRYQALQRLSEFLDQPLDSDIGFKPVYFFFLMADGKDAEEALLIDFNLIYRMTEQQRIDFLAHEYFHNYRRYFENNDFNHQCDLNFMLDMIQNEGIADQIDKSDGYESYYAQVQTSEELAEIMVGLYDQAEKDLEILQGLIVRYANHELDENKLIDELLKVYKYNGHAIGFFMSQQIVKAGLKKEMTANFYNPYAFYKCYNRAAIKNGTLPLRAEFLDYLKEITKEYY